MLRDLGGSAQSLHSEALDAFAPTPFPTLAGPAIPLLSGLAAEPGTGPDPVASRHLASFAKRFLDVALSLALLVLVLPLMLQLACLVKLSSRGPVLFRQARSGLDGRSFEILKFRTMRCGCDADPSGFVRQASVGDDRVTPLGRWMRRLSLDELPQLLNVLKGDMSLVGPRPHAVGHDRYYAEHLPAYGLRFRARPGITGLAQVSGARGPTSTHADMQRRLDFDLAYTSRASLVLDLMILFRTAQALLRWDEAF